MNDLSKFTMKDLVKEIERRHKLWFYGDSKGERADFSNIELCKANLYKANLYKADLCDADLSCAIFFNANLCGASMYYASFTNADLSGADFTNTNLSKANFDRANMRDAKLGDADFGNERCLFDHDSDNSDFINYRQKEKSDESDKPDEVTS